MGTRNGQWYTVTCAGNGVTGDRIELRTTQSTYLSISGIEVWTGAPISSSSSTTTTTSSGEYTTKPGTKLKLQRASQSSPYGNNSFPATNAFGNGRTFTHTNAGVGMWWKAHFGGKYWISRVKVLNRHNCCGGRLADVKIFIGDEECGQIEKGTRNG